MKKYCINQTLNVVIESSTLTLHEFLAGISRHSEILNKGDRL